MPLDSAQFISELSIDDPPGTDPLNQGDDQIRTTKRATQQSFPNVDAAVPQTAAQMAQMAIKNEINQFTQVQLFVDGSAGVPSISFSAQQSTGFYRPGTSIGFTIGGTDAAFLLPAQFRMIQDGTSINPAFSFQNDVGTGIYRPGTSLGFTVAGLDAAFLLPAQFRMIEDGIAAAPAYSFQGSSNMGMFRQFSTSLGFAVAGVQQMAILSGQIRSFGNGTAAIPAWSFQSGSGDMGMFRKSTTELGFSISGNESMSLADSINLPRGGVLMDDVGGTQTATVNFRRAGANRWRFVMSTDVGSNDLTLRRHNAAGTQLDIPMTFGNINGLIFLTTLPTTNPGIAGALWRNPVSPGFVAIV